MTSSDFPELIVVVLSMNVSDDVLETTCNLFFHPSNVVVADVSINVQRGSVDFADVVLQLILSVVDIHEIVIMLTTHDALIPSAFRIVTTPNFDHHLPGLCPSFE